MQPFSPHNRFFSSLNQLQSRLSSESRSKTQTPQPPRESNPSLSSSSSSSSSSPLYITTPKPHHQPTTTTSSSSSSGPPPDFLSDPPATQHQETDSGGVDDIGALMGLLGLSIASSPETSASCSCDCSGDGFYKNVVGAKGPRRERERRRLDGWIELYRRERAEPARLAHLMIGKSVTLSRDCGGGFDGVEFPATVEEFLERDP